MIRVVFYSEDRSSRKLEAKMTSVSAAIGFQNRYRYTGGFYRFSMDIFGYTEQPLPVIRCSGAGFLKVYRNLYPWDKLW